MLGVYHRRQRTVNVKMPKHLFAHGSFFIKNMEAGPPRRMCAGAVRRVQRLISGVSALAPASSGSTR